MMEWQPHTKEPDTGITAIIAVYPDGEYEDATIFDLADYAPCEYNEYREPIRYKWSRLGKEMPEQFWWLEAEKLEKLVGFPQKKPFLKIVR